jgi:ketosteroid isomerase-like protein
MNEQANLQTIRRFYQTINDGDLAATLKLIADDLDWKDAGADKDIYPWIYTLGALRFAGRKISNAMAKRHLKRLSFRFFNRMNSSWTETP